MLSSILFQFLVILAAAVIVGEIFRQIGFSSVAGELISGIIVGPSLLGLVSDPVELSPIAFVSLFFIIYQLGFNAKTEKLKKYVSKGFTVTLSAFVAPFLITLAIARSIFSFGAVEDFVLAIAVSVPSISVVSVLVRDSGIEEKESGHIILSAIVMVDVLAFIVLAAVTRTITDTLRIILFTALFIGAFLALDFFITRNLVGIRGVFRKAAGLIKGEELAYAALILTGLVVSELFQVMGLVYVLGAFFAALIVHDEVIGVKLFEKVSKTVSSMNKAFFAPFFFGFAGSEVILTESSYFSIASIILLSLLLVGISVSLTYFSTGRFFRGNSAGRRSVSVIMAGKGSVGIIIANVSLDAGIISYQVNSLVILATIVGSLMVTLMLRGHREEAAMID